VLPRRTRLKHDTATIDDRHIRAQGPVRSARKVDGVRRLRAKQLPVAIEGEEGAGRNILTHDPSVKPYRNGLDLAKKGRIAVSSDPFMGVATVCDLEDRVAVGEDEAPVLSAICDIGTQLGARVKRHGSLTPESSLPTVFADLEFLHSLLRHEHGNAIAETTDNV
jgi:hypothetical protein